MSQAKGRVLQGMRTLSTGWLCSDARENPSWLWPLVRWIVLLSALLLLLQHGAMIASVASQKLYRPFGGLDYGWGKRYALVVDLAGFALLAALGALLLRRWFLKPLHVVRSIRLELLLAWGSLFAVSALFVQAAQLSLLSPGSETWTPVTGFLVEFLRATELDSKVVQRLAIGLCGAPSAALVLLAPFLLWPGSGKAEVRGKREK